MKLITTSGAEYISKETHPISGLIDWIRKDPSTGELKESGRAIAIYPDRLPAVLASTSWKVENGRMAGFNQQGTRTCLLIQGQVLPGMILMNPRSGLRSTRITKVID